MLILRLIVVSSLCWMARCDLLDLYVQHMDETMKTLAYRNRHHPKDITSRIKRSLREEPLLRVGTFKKQRLDVDKEWYAQWKAKRKIPYKEDGLDFPNSREENLDPSQHELVNNASGILGKVSEETTIALVETNETVDAFDIELSNEDSTWFNDTASSDRQSIEINGDPRIESREETTQTTDLHDDVEIEGNSQFEIISETGTAGPSLFDDPILKRIPKSRDRVPKKYIPPTDKLAKLFRGYKYVDYEETVDNRPRRSVKEPKFTRHEKLDDDGEVILEWDPSDDEMVTFKVTAKTLGYIGIGFNEKNHMKGADILLAWVDDHTRTANLLLIGPRNAADSENDKGSENSAIAKLFTASDGMCTYDDYDRNLLQAGKHVSQSESEMHRPVGGSSEFPKDDRKALYPLRGTSLRYQLLFCQVVKRRGNIEKGEVAPDQERTKRSSEKKKRARVREGEEARKKQKDQVVGFLDEALKRDGEKVGGRKV
ncbi:hypothetical protein WN48_08107 [Eufriesea mexicana]|uniref:DOMON domain-containing protein n=1 Tax=Eufriesea mexicana TaxID=516756 RepID=A0A310S866_9HYME|nr:hypothetical protein WN48_08107 [Eufriesea mexicana]